MLYIFSPFNSIECVTSEIVIIYAYFLVFQSREEDMNRDGILDDLKFQLDMPMADSEEVLGVTLILIFDYKLRVSNTVIMYPLCKSM